MGAASREERDEYADHLQLCLNTCGKDGILVLGTDSNASASVRSVHDDPYAPGRDMVRAPHGIPYQNTGGQELCVLLGAQECCLASTFFMNSPSHAETYGTWQSPGSKDHVVVRQRDLKRVRDCGRVGLHGKNSDHYAMRLVLRLARKLIDKHKFAKGPARKRIDRANPNIEAAFIDQVNVAMSTTHAGIKLQHLEESIRTAAEKTLTTVNRRQPGWFEAAKAQIEPTIMANNSAQFAYHTAQTEATKARLKVARKNSQSPQQRPPGSKPSCSASTRWAMEQAPQTAGRQEHDEEAKQDDVAQTRRLQVHNG